MSTACPAWLSSKPGIASARTIGTVPHARTHTILDMDMPVKKCIRIKDTCILSRHNHFGSQRKCILCFLRFQKACILSCHDHFGCDKVLPIFSGCVSYCIAHTWKLNINLWDMCHYWNININLWAMCHYCAYMKVKYKFTWYVSLLKLLTKNSNWLQSQRSTFVPSFSAPWAQVRNNLLGGRTGTRLNREASGQVVRWGHHGNNALSIGTAIREAAIAARRFADSFNIQST